MGNYQSTKIHKVNISKFKVVNSLNIFIDIFVSHYDTKFGKI